MSKLLNSPHTLHETPIPLNIVVHLIVASISHDQIKLIKRWVENFLTKLCYYSPAAALQGTCRLLTMGKRRPVTFLLPTSFLRFSHEVKVCPYGPRKTRGMMSKVCDSPCQLEQMQNLDSPRQVTDNCTATNWLSFNLSITDYILYSLTMVHILKSCVELYRCYFCCTELHKCIFVVPQWTGSLTYQKGIKWLNIAWFKNHIFKSSIQVRIPGIAHFLFFFSYFFCSFFFFFFFRHIWKYLFYIDIIIFPSQEEDWKF